MNSCIQNKNHRPKKSSTEVIKARAKSERANSIRCKHKHFSTSKQRWANWLWRETKERKVPGYHVYVCRKDHNKPRSWKLHKGRKEKKKICKVSGRKGRNQTSLFPSTDTSISIPFLFLSLTEPIILPNINQNIAKKKGISCLLFQISMRTFSHLLVQISLQEKEKKAKWERKKTPNNMPSFYHSWPFCFPFAPLKLCQSLTRERNQ